ncbi:MAG: YdcF family protein [Bryobacteraceae bacterium]|nr:YdcF family protein [Bryobacteraceae bacterium]MDW8380135.1 YdcF family protein [Bryobacterales bacterium]
MSPEQIELARRVWDYHHLHHEPQPADVILAFGSHDVRVAEAAAEFFLRGFGQLLLCTGGIAHQGDLLETPWACTEAEKFAEVAQACGVPPEAILIEPKATNTAENIRFARAMLEAVARPPRRVLLVMKPFMQRRVFATHAVEWPEMPATVASPKLTFEEYCVGEFTPERVTHIMLGDLQRLWVYARKGYSAPQRIPKHVREAFEQLVAQGFTRHLLPEE